MLWSICLFIFWSKYWMKLWRSQSWPFIKQWPLARHLLDSLITRVNLARWVTFFSIRSLANGGKFGEYSKCQLFWRIWVWRVAWDGHYGLARLVYLPNSPDLPNYKACNMKCQKIQYLWQSDFLLFSTKSHSTFWFPLTNPC
jgi:hypothetical protein